MVRLEPCLASNFLKLDKDEQEFMISQGAVPVNDIFFPFYRSKSTLLLLYGGPGSGKSSFCADRLIDFCLNDKYFKCGFGRKTLKSVRETVFATIISRIEDRGLQAHFTYSKKTSSSMVITCITNGNYFIPFGAKDPNTHKGLNEITHIWYDEMDQGDQEDFQVLLTRLRTPKAEYTQFIGSFNTEKVTPRHWIIPLFFNQKSSFVELLRIAMKDESIDYSIDLCLANYDDNFFINKREYEMKLMIAAAFNETRFRELARGEWGTGDETNVFAWGFKSDKHIVDVATEYGRQFMAVDRSKPVFLSFDFNVDPFTCIVCQHDGLSWIKIIDEYRLRNSDIFVVLDRIKAEYGNYFLVATGDATGRNRDAGRRGAVSNVYTIQQYLRLSDNQIQFATKNPQVKDTRNLVNILFKKHPHFYISSACLHLKADLEQVTVDEYGEVEKKKMEEKGLNHLLDTLRYYVWGYFRTFLKLLSEKEN